MTLDAALHLSWERLNLLARAHERRAARQMLQFMIAAQGAGDCWRTQAETLKQMLKAER